MLFKDVAKAGDWFLFDSTKDIINGIWRVESNDKKRGLMIIPGINDVPTTKHEIQELNSMIQDAVTLATQVSTQPISLAYIFVCKPPHLRYYLTVKKDAKVVYGDGSRDNPYKIII